MFYRKKIFSFKYCCLFSVVSIVFVISVYQYISNVYYSRANVEFKSCIRNSNDRSLYNLNTKLGVTYDGSHWFHIAENFMTQHSILRSKNRQSNTNEIYFNFDKPGFTTKLNGVTKIMIVLGTFQIPPADIENKKYKFYFSHLVDSVSSNAITLESGSGEKNILIEKSNIKEILLETITPETPTAQRFVRNQQVKIIHKSQFRSDSAKRRSLQGIQLSLNSSVKESSHSFISDELCLKGIETIGGIWPTVQRGHWFPNKLDVESFRDKIRFLCPIDVPLLNINKKRSQYKLAIYQRNLSRKLVDQDNVIRILNERLTPKGKWEIVVIMHKSDRSPCEIAHLLNDVDVLLTPHGFQSMLLLFMKRPAVLFEVFPYRYYKRAYGPLSLEYGIIHGGAMSPSMSWINYVLLSGVKTQWCMENKQCRSYARNSDVMLTRNGVNRLLMITQAYIKNHYEGKKREFDKLYP